MTSPVLRRGLSITERRTLRDRNLQRRLEQARREAAADGLTEKCRRALIVATDDMAGAGETARDLHESCQGEHPGGQGCLCLCHDLVQGSVEGAVVLAGKVL